MFRTVTILVYLLLFAFLSSSSTAQSHVGKVVSVKDGDTIELRTDSSTVRIRLNGIDCPEHNQAFGTKAKQFTSDLCFGQQVTVKTFGQDKYGRTIGDVILDDGRVVNRELVSAGLAWWYRQYSKDETLGKLEEEAKNAKRGLWSDKNPQAPWEFRKNPKKTTVEPENSGISVEFEQEYVPASQTEDKPFIGNISSKKFHVSGCSSAGKIVSGNRVPFGTADEAVKAGYEPCKICSPTGETVAPVETESSGRCQATTKKGTQCKRNAVAGNKYCWQHNN